MSDRLYVHRVYALSVILMISDRIDLEPSPEFKSTFNRQLERQLFNELWDDYGFPRAVCRSLSDLFMKYLDLYYGGLRGEGQIVFYAASKNVPPGVPVEEMHLVPVRLTLYSPEDNLICSADGQYGILDQRMIRVTNEAFFQGALLTQADIAILLGESTKTISRHIAILEDRGKIIPTRGKWKDIGPGISHKKRILEYYLKGDEYTDLERKTKHSGEAIMRYIKDFSRVLILKEEGYSVNEVRMISGLSEKTISEYLDLIEEYSQEEYEERYDQIRLIFRKKTLNEAIQETRVSDRQGR